MSIASGLVGHRADRTRAVDLVCKQKENPFYYRFIELKVNRSAEWLKHVSLDSPIFHASRIDLCVLAPKNYYNDYQLDWLEIGLNDALNEIIETQLAISHTLGT